MDGHPDPRPTHLRPTEARHKASDGLQSRPGAVALAEMLSAQVAALSALQPVLDAIEQVAQAAAAVLNGGGKLAYVGAGSSGLMALADALELAGTFGIAPDRTPILFAGGAAALLHMTGGVEDDPALALADLDRAALRPGDMALCLTASGSTPYTLTVAEAARAQGVTVAGFANVPGARLFALSDIAVLLDTGPEIVSGSTRLGAATAQKVALNLFSVRLGILLGHVHDGYMVNLVADNDKLRERAARIVSALSGRDMDAARQALLITGGAVKPAVLIAAGATLPQAEAALTDSAGALGPALMALNTQEAMTTGSIV